MAGAAPFSPRRRDRLDALAAHLRERYQVGMTLRVTVICTHNSRRSHLAQVWLAHWLATYRIPAEIHSAGTEVTAVYPAIVSTLREADFDIRPADSSETDNPRYLLRLAADGEPLSLYSKRLDDPALPAFDFTALLVCDGAAEACPVVAGAEARFVLPFRDPKWSDGTTEMAAAYRTASEEINESMKYLANRIQQDE